MRTRRRPAGATSFVALCVGSLAACSSGAGGDAETLGVITDGQEVCEAPVFLATLPDELFEASGIVRDPRRHDLFWVHNDSGNDAKIYGIDLSGKVVAVVPFAGASNRDPEDIAIGPCPEGDCLYLADIGDNLAVHESIMIHRFPLPDLPASSAIGIIEGSPIEPNASWRLVYEDGPRDSEALVVDAERSELLVISKGRNDEIVLYAIALADLHDQLAETDTLRRVGRLHLPIGTNSSQFVTAADLSPDASTLAVRSYTTLYLFAWEGSAAFDTATVPGWASLISAREAQGEGLSWDVAGHDVLLVSEGRGSTTSSLSRMRCPDWESWTD